jgi:hypothetical protein
MEKQDVVHSHLFLVRIWMEDLGEGESEWRGRVQDVMRGESAYFRNFQGLVLVLEQIVDGNDASLIKNTTESS